MFKNLFKYFSSMKTGMVLLIMIGITAGIGSTFYPSVFPDIFIFKLLIALLFINMTLCTINRLYKLKWRFWTQFYKNQAGFRQLGIIILHAGFVIILIGGTLNTFKGQNTVISIIEGRSINVSDVIKTNQPFEIELNKFEIEFYENGFPSQYYSYLTIKEKNIVKDNIIINVNNPLNYNNVKAYQQSFGNMIEIGNNHSDDCCNENLYYEGAILKLPNTERKVKLFRYIPDYHPSLGMNTRSLRSDNPRLVFSVYENDSLLGIGKAEMGEEVFVDEKASFIFIGVKPYTVLKIKTDPGLPLATIGGFMMMLGVMITLFSITNNHKANNKGGIDRVWFNR